NYRSTARILRSANTLIAHNPKIYEKKLWSDRGLGDRIEVVLANHEEHEAELVVRKIELHRMSSRTRYSDYAILYRGNHQARHYEQQLRNSRIPYLLSGGASFFDRLEIKGVISWLRVLTNPDDNPAFLRAVTIPRRGIGAQTLEKLGVYATSRSVSLFAAISEVGLQEHLQPRQADLLYQFGDFIGRLREEMEQKPVVSMLDFMMEAIGYQAWIFESAEPERARSQWKNVCEFVEWIGKKAQESGKSMKELVQSIALINLLDGQDDTMVDAVKLSTLHAAKGLEFDHVYMVGVEEGILPHRESVEEGRVEEERRLMYVGMTRARKTLTISYCKKRRRARDYVPVESSRFIGELYDEDLRFSGQDLPAEEQKVQAAGWLEKMHAMVNRER
ncbi:MAG: ATP-binding domain-containing protein, partial [Pseudomonadota bacterium]|nr:ATP-binding domain-containing protein [Pseudomonadota bacterium]